MDIKVVLKLIALNLGIAVADIALYSERFVGLSFTDGTILSQTIAILCALVSIAVFGYGNGKILKKWNSPPKPVLMVSSAADNRKIERTLEECEGRLRELGVEVPAYKAPINRAISQIHEFKELDAVIREIADRNGLTNPDVFFSIDRCKDHLISRMAYIITCIIGDERDMVQKFVEENNAIFLQLRELKEIAINWKGSGNLDSTCADLETTLTAMKAFNQQFERRDFGS